MNGWKTTITFLACCVCLTISTSASADYIGLTTVNKDDPDTAFFCTQGNGDFVPGPLTLCNVFATFNNPVDRLLSVGDADIVASNGLFFQHPFNPVVTAPSCFFIDFFAPDLICDSFVTIGYKCAPEPAGTDATTPDGDFDVIEFASNGHVVGGWFNSAVRNGQGDAGTWPDLQVLFLQLSVPPGESITGIISVFALINEEVVAFNNEVVDCLAVNVCPPGEPCDDGNPCTI
ncbi:MAG: hypothetical protein IIA33_10700, partial [Planctomycetes bacterium]|nr:hypothetical protein [Planctomycetota bacterium]